MKEVLFGIGVTAVVAVLVCSPWPADRGSAPAPPARAFGATPPEPATDSEADLHPRVRRSAGKPNPAGEAGDENQPGGASEREAAGPPATPTKLEPVARIEAPAVAGPKDVERVLRDVIPPLLEPIVRRAQALEERMDRQEADGAAVRSEVAQGQAEVRAELKELWKSVRDLTREKDTLKTATADRLDREPVAETTRLRSTVDNLAKTLDGLARKVNDLNPPAKPPEPPTTSWNTRKRFLLPCGFVTGEMTVPPDGVYVRCPLCGQLGFGK